MDKRLELYFFLFGGFESAAGGPFAPLASCLDLTTNGLLSGSDPGKVDVRFLFPTMVWSYCIVLPGAGGFLDFLFSTSSGEIRADSGQQGEFQTDLYITMFSLEILPLITFLAYWPLWPCGRTFLRDPIHVAFSVDPPD